MRRFTLTLAACLFAWVASGATLEKLTLDDMAARSAAIVRAQAVSSTALFIGSTIYTQTRFQVLETWKGTAQAEVLVTEPGGAVASVAQKYSGVPQFAPGREMVLFLWTGPSGRSQVMGLSQGIFDVNRSSSGGATVQQEASGSTLLAPGTGKPVQEQPISLSLADLAARVKNAGSGNKK